VHQFSIVICNNYGLFHTVHLAMYARTAVMAMVFKKSLNLSPSNNGARTTGEVLTLMSSDAERIWFCSILLNWLWMGPLQIIATIILLYLREKNCLIESNIIYAFNK